MEASKFKDELRARITDFAVTHYLIGLPENKTNAVKKKQAEEAYKKLEDWILENRLGTSSNIDGEFSVSEPSPINEDQQAMDF